MATKLHCPKCRSIKTWKIGSVPTLNGRKPRFKCTKCGTSFYERKPRVKKS